MIYSVLEKYKKYRPSSTKFNGKNKLLRVFV